MAAGKRPAGMSFKDYRVNLKLHEGWVKSRLLGRLVWNSSPLVNGTYRRPKGSPHWSILKDPRLVSDGR